MSKSYCPIIEKYNIARPSFSEGMGRILDIGGTMTPRITVKRVKRINRNNYKAIRSYWESVGNHLYNALDDCESLSKKKDNKIITSH